jgi:hypothetical protein
MTRAPQKICGECGVDGEHTIWCSQAGPLIRESGCPAKAGLAGESLDRHGQSSTSTGEGVSPADRAPIDEAREQ